MSILDLRNGQRARIISIQGGTHACRKLENMGIRVGAHVQNLSGHFPGGPVVVQSGHTQVAIGRGLASKIIVEIV